MATNLLVLSVALGQSWCPSLGFQNDERRIILKFLPRDSDLA